MNSLYRSSKRQGIWGFVSSTVVFRVGGSLARFGPKQPWDWDPGDLAF